MAVPPTEQVQAALANAPGPPVPLCLAGARLLELLPMMPVMGNLTHVVAVLSYTGQLNLTVAADHHSCPDLEAAMICEAVGLDPVLLAQP